MGKNNIKKYLFISVKPEFANKILTREKCIELRKIKPHVNSGDYVIIYASSPKKCVIGFGEIKQIIETTPEQMWEKYSKVLGIDEPRFYSYYKDKNKAIGIEIGAIKSINPISLDELRKIDIKFNPPQVYRYVSNEQICKIIAEYL